MVEFELFPIKRGRYDVYLHFASHKGNTDRVQGFWDGSRFGGVLDFEHQKRDPVMDSWNRDFNTSEFIGRLILTETKSHTLKFLSLESGFGNFKYLALWPVVD